METRGSSVVDVQRYLIKDERVVWSAQPVRKFFLKYLFSQDPSRFLGYYFIVFGLVFALMPLLVFVSMPPGPPSKGEPPIILFAVFGLFFAGMGYVLSFGRRRRVIKQLGNTAYYLTNARAFIVSGADGPTVTAIDLRRMPQTSLWLVDGDGRATGGGGMKAGGTEVGGGRRGARRIDSSSSGVARRICSVMRAASTAVPTTRGVIRSKSSVFSIFSSVDPKR